MRIVSENGLIALHPREVAVVRRPGDADHRVDQDLGLGLFRRPDGEVVGQAVHGPAGVKGDHAAPPQLDETRLQFRRSVTELLVVVVGGELEPLDRPPHVVGAAFFVQVANSGMPAGSGAVDALGLAVLVHSPARIHRQHREHEAFSVPQRDRRPGLQRIREGAIHVQGHRHRPDLAFGKSQALEHRVVGRLVHEASQRMEGAVQQQLEVAELTLAERDRGQIRRLRLQCARPLFSHEQRRRVSGSLRQGTLQVAGSGAGFRSARRMRGASRA